MVIREIVREGRDSVGRKPIDVPGYVFRIFVTTHTEAPQEIWRDYNRRSDMNRIAELKHDLGADGFCLKQFFVTEAAFGPSCCCSTYWPGSSAPPACPDGALKRGLDRRTRLQQHNLIGGRRAHTTNNFRGNFTNVTGPINGGRSLARVLRSKYPGIGLSPYQFHSLPQLGGGMGGRATMRLDDSVLGASISPR